MQSSIKEEFVPALAREANKRVVGDPTNDTSVIGPLIEPSALDRVLGYVQQARADGARIVTGGEKPARRDRRLLHRGYRHQRLTPEMTVTREEIYGPCRGRIVLQRR